jgi:hypothetical protein
MSGKRKALIVANDEYEQSALRDLLAPAADAEALGRVLGDRQVGDFAVQVVRNEASHVIQAQIEELFSESRSDDVLLLHFSGHGLKSESGELFFAASNTRPNRLGSTAVSADFVQRCMQASRSRSVVLLLDCCYGGAFAQGVKVRAAGDVNVLDSFPRETKSGAGRGRAVITASSAMEYAFEGEQLADDQNRRPSVFTNALVEGLATGDADRDEDGWVSLNELYDYVFDKVREQNPHQTPSRQIQLEGELYLARSRRHRIRAAPLPPDLQAALADPNMYTRLGALSELRSRLASGNLPAAAGAYEALAELARNDIQAVADPAAAVLNQAALHPEETELHFGERRQGSEPPHRTVRLLGPPIARACASRASHDWIRVDETDEGFDISVDTTGIGVLSGTLDLKGTTGEAAIAIDVELLPPVPQAPPPPGEAPGQRSTVTGGSGQPEAGRQQAADSALAEPPVPPKLELSATTVDFGLLPLNSEPAERLVRLSNAGGGSLNARVATKVDWLRLRQDGEELFISVDTSVAGEHRSAVTVDSDGGSATIRVQARVVPSAPAEAAVGARREGTATEVPGQGAGLAAPPSTAPVAAGTAHVEETASGRELADSGRPPGAQSAGSAAHEAWTPPGTDRTSVSPTRRGSWKAWIFGGAFAGIVLVVVAVLVLANVHTPPPKFHFRDDFSSAANGWSVVGRSSSGQYANGTYRIYLEPVKYATGVAIPSNSRGLHPAPSSVTIGVSAHRTAGTVYGVFYGIVCKADSSGSEYYDFEVSGGGAFIDKDTTNSYKTLAKNLNVPVSASGTNQLRAACISARGGKAVHLVFWINEKKVLDVTDRTNPITSGTVGLVVDRAYHKTAAAAEFDNFVVTKN